LVALEEEDLFLHLLPGVDTEKYELVKEMHHLLRFRKESPKVEELDENEDFAAAA
jgi:hypothetical protein